MARKKKRRLRLQRRHYLAFCLLFLCAVGGFSAYHYVNADADQVWYGKPIDPNIGIRMRVEEFFLANDAPEMIPIISCESRFRHYDKDGTPLVNRAGSSAVGVAQILASTHPDPKVLTVYNRTHNTDLIAEDFDITTLEGNLGYALVLYEVRGTRDWECAKKFRFQS